jgi:hypothetical protein
MCGRVIPLVLLALASLPLAPVHDLRGDNQGGGTVTERSGPPSSPVSDHLACAQDGGTNTHEESARNSESVLDPRQWQPITWFTFLLVIVGGFQAAVLFQTVTTMRALERPWIIPEPRGEFGGFESESWLEEFLSQRTDTAEVLEYALTNYGKSPAWIVGKNVRLAIIPNPLPPHPVDLHPIAISPVPVAPNKSLVDRARAQVTPEIRARLLVGDFSLVFYGYVRYRDIFGKTHPADFCLVWEKSKEWVPGRERAWLVHGGPPGWSRQK